MKFFLKAPAKLNLFLKIGPKRADGYHSILSLFQTISLFDEIEITTSSTDSLICDLPLLPEENLVFKALKKLRAKADFPPLEIKLKKNIPPGSGLGGASSDAASVLKGINNFFALGLSFENLRKLSLEVGSDVPYFLVGGTCLVKGRGEVVKKLSSLPACPLLLFLPHFSISTALAYSWWDGYVAQNPELLKEFNSLDYTRISWGENDFEKVILERYPLLKEVRKIAQEIGVEFTGLSGTGSALFALSQEAGRLRNLKKAWERLPGKVIEAVFETSEGKEKLSCQFR